jgi:hypothetical protein
MPVPGGRVRRAVDMKNLVIFHLESISRQRLAMFAASFPNTSRLLRDCVVFDTYLSSATSTLMVVTYCLHGNDYEYDTCAQFAGMRPLRNNPSLLALLRNRGYATQVIALNGFHAQKPVLLNALSDDSGPVWGTNDFPAIFAKFDALTDAQPFAIYVWDLLTHIEHSQALAPFSDGLTDQLRRACGVADDGIGVMLSTLERKGLLANTAIVLYGDHGDDPWTHGFKGGMIHGTEPYTDITWAPLAIRDPGLAPGNTDRLASTIDIAPTCLALLGVDERMPFAASGIDLFNARRLHAFSQNYTATQPDNVSCNIRKAFCVSNDTFTLMASSKGLELYAYRIDPGNHCNLLNFFDIDAHGRLAYVRRADASPHFRAALQDNPRSIDALTRDFALLRDALGAHVGAKRAHVVAHGVDPRTTLDPRCFVTINRSQHFFGHVDAARSPMPAFEYTYNLR